MELYDDVSYKVSKLLTNKYSTSFSLGIKAFTPEYREPIYAIYGFVRLADEIVDTFHDHDKKYLLDQLRKETFEAINRKISTNPIIHSFQLTVNKYKIDHKLITAFLDSMEMDLTKSNYGRVVYDQYIYGSAEVVGLMCLKIFVQGNQEHFNTLLHAAKMLGSAFQKVNFLRDIKSDIDERGRIYIPDIHSSGEINDTSKKELEKEIENEFKQSLEGIFKLPAGVKLGVYSAYLYYYVLFKKIQGLNLNELLKARVRVSNFHKLALLIKSYWKIKVLGLNEVY